jgi:hypothetical protein
MATLAANRAAWRSVGGQIGKRFRWPGRLRVSILNPTEESDGDHAGD